MIIAAISDVHSPRYYEDFIKSIDFLRIKPDLFLMNGDMIDRGDINEYDKIYNVLFGKIHCPIVSIFGNNEFAEIRQDVMKKFPEIKFLDDSAAMLNVSGRSVGIVGTTGSLDTATPWQKKNVPNIENVYSTRVSIVDRLLQRMQADFKIVMFHYSPTYKTLEGENPRFYSSMGSQTYELVLTKHKPNLVLHGHSHRGLKMTWIDTVPIFNTAFSVNRGIVLIDTDKDLRPGIAKFI